VETNKFMPKGWGQQLADSLNKTVSERNKEPSRKEVLAKEIEKKAKK
jgi:hypothetical protein